MGAVRASPELVALGKDGRGEDRFTSREMIDTEQRLKGAALRLADRSNHRLPAAAMERAIDAAGRNGLVLGGEQKAALAHIVRPRNLAMVTGYAGPGKSAMLGVALEAWAGAGSTVQGLALPCIAAQNLERATGITTRPTA